MTSLDRNESAETRIVPMSRRPIVMFTTRRQPTSRKRVKRMERVDGLERMVPVNSLLYEEVKEWY